MSRYRPTVHGLTTSALRISSCKGRIVHRIAIQRPPVRRHAQHHGVSAVLRIILHEPHEFQTLGQRVFSAVVESKAPNRHHRLALVMQVCLVPRNLHPIDQQFPIVHHPLHLPGAQSRKIVHHRISPAIEICPFAAMSQHRVELPQSRRAGYFSDKSLHKNAVYAIFSHPLEMPQHRLAIKRAVNLGRPAVGMTKRRGIAFVRIEFS